MIQPIFIFISELYFAADTRRPPCNLLRRKHQGRSTLEESHYVLHSNRIPLDYLLTFGKYNASVARSLSTRFTPALPRSYKPSGRKPQPQDPGSEKRTWGTRRPYKTRCARCLRGQSVQTWVQWTASRAPQRASRASWVVVRISVSSPWAWSSSQPRQAARCALSTSSWRVK